MSEEITINNELGIIEVFSHGKLTHEDSISSIAAIEKLMNETGVMKVLSDTRKQVSAPSTTGIFEFGARLPRSVKIAVIVSEEQPTAEDVSFLENVALNRGVNIKTFSSSEDALGWLQN